MTTFFDSLPGNYATVSVAAASHGIETKGFLDATRGLTRLFDTLGTAFAVVKSDMQGNITKLQTRHDQAPAKSATLQDLVNAEKAEKKSTATEGLLWLKRGLQFTAFGLRRNIDNPIEELSVSFGKAYELTLSKHHNFMIRGVFSLAMNACPSRAEFYKKLAGEDPAKMKEQLSAWLSALEKQVQVIDQFLKSTGDEK